MSTMKRYLAFFGETYYPLGGMKDLIGDFDYVSDAIQAISDAHKEHDIHNHGWDGHVWCHVYDTETKSYVYGCPIEFRNPVPGSWYESEDEPRMLRVGDFINTRDDKDGP